MKRPKTSDLFDPTRTGWLRGQLDELIEEIHSQQLPLHVTLEHLLVALRGALGEPGK